MDADDRQWPVLEHGDDPVTDTIEVLHQVPLRRASSVEQGLVEVRQRHALAGLVPTRAVHRQSDGSTR